METVTETAGQVVIVDRTGTEGRHTSLTVEPGRIPGRWPVKVAVAVGYDGPTSLHLTTDEALALVDAVRTLVGPDPRIAELEADVARYRAYFEEDERLIEKLGSQLARLRDGAA